jgi:hypothetical protein
VLALLLLLLLLIVAAVVLSRRVTSVPRSLTLCMSSAAGVSV